MQKKLYLNAVDGYATDFTQAVELIDAEYNTVVRQDQVKSYLIFLRLSNYVSEGLNQS